MRLNKKRIKHLLDRCWPTDLKAEAESAERVWAKIEEELTKHDTSLRCLSGDGWTAPALKQREFQILTAAATLGGKGSANKICDLVSTWAGDLGIARVVVTLQDLSQRGLVAGRQSVPEPGDRERKSYQVTEDGERALARARAEGKQLAKAREAIFEPGCPQ